MKPKIVLAAVSVTPSHLLTKYYYKLPSLGIGYIAAVLLAKGYDVTLIDGSISAEEISDQAESIVSMRPDIVGFYCISENFAHIMQILRIVKSKSPSSITVIGGPHVYGLPEQGMGFDWIDYAFWGEAEIAFLQFIESRSKPSLLGQIDGLIYRYNGAVTINPMAIVDDLDALPLPARHLYPPLKRYRPSILAYRRLPATGIITSRGCAHKCIFCHSGKGHFRLRFHSAEYVVEEMKKLKEDFGINELVIFDDTFLINKKRVVRICEDMIRENLNLSWSCNARVNNLDKKLLRLIKKAGCWMIQVGVESGNPSILRKIKKGITLKQVEQGCKLAYDEGLEVKAYFIMGHPGETIETLDDTIRFMNRLPIHYASINFMTPLPGTELWDVAEDCGAINKRQLEKINYLSDTPAFVPYGLNEETLVSKLREAYLRFYLNPVTVFRHIKKLKRVEDVRKIIIAGIILFRLFLSKLKGRKE